MIKKLTITNRLENFLRLMMIQIVRKVLKKNLIHLIILKKKKFHKTLQSNYLIHLTSVFKNLQINHLMKKANFKI